MKVSVLGCGTVGGGVLTELTAAGLDLGPALVRAGKVREIYQTSNFQEILCDPSVDAVVETLGGLEPARNYCAAALQAGKSVVTANKALVADSGPELAALARENGAGFLFSSACGGGIPFLPNLSASAGDISALGGVLNGTTNFLLDSMQRRGIEFSAALAEARALGYAEADPSDDLSGLDTARKLALACAVGFSLLPPEESVAREGVRAFTPEDAQYLNARGLVCRLYARAERSRGGGYSACVQPTLFPASAPESALRGCENLARYGEGAQSVTLMGSGAGRRPTAGAVIRDLLTLRRGRPVMLPEDCRRAEPDNNLLRCRYLFRIPPALAGEITGSPEIFGCHVWIKTDPMPVSSAHALAARLRARGPVFFAALAKEEEKQ